jgi:hypothetical protein
MRQIYVLKCGDCPLYLPEVPAIECGWNGAPPIPDKCTHPANDGITLGGSAVLPHKCPMIREPLTYRAVLQRNPK